MNSLYDEDLYLFTNMNKRSPRRNTASIDQLVDFNKLRTSALTKAAEISPSVKEVTIGPNSPLKKEIVVTPPPKTERIKMSHTENINQDKLGEHLRPTILYQEYESQLRENSDIIFKNLIYNMVAKRTETMAKYWHKQSEVCERKAKELQERKLQMLRDLQENDNLSVLEKAKLDEKNTKILNKQTLEHMNRILEEQNKATARFAAITDSNTKICICQNEIMELIQTQEHAKAVYEKYAVSIDAVMSNINSILDPCNIGSIGDKDVKQSEILAANMENTKKKIINEINDIRNNHLKKQEEEAAKKRLEDEQKAHTAKLQQEKEIKAQTQIAQPKQTEQTKPLFFSTKNYTYFTELKNFLEQYERQYKDLTENPTLKKFRFDCQKAVNTPVNAISSVSGVHMRDKFDKLSKLLKGERVQVLDTYVQVTQHPQGLPYVTALLAKKIVRQGDLLVSSNPEAAFPLAAVTVALWAQFPEFGKLLEAYFHRECPYLVPMFLPQQEGQTDKEFYKSRGYTYNEDGVVEKQDKFLKRMSGVFRLRCAIWIAKTPQFINAPNPHGLQYAWQWLASFVNLKPEPDICATLLNDFFTVCGSECYKMYGHQFTKVIKVICSEYLQILQNIDEGGPKTRLEVFLQNVIQTGLLPPPTGLLAPNTW